MKPRLIYNARDAFATRKLFDEIHPQLDEQTARVYRAFMGLSGPLLAVQMRGIKVDLDVRREVVQALSSEAKTKSAEADCIAGTSLFGDAGGVSTKKLGEWLYDELKLKEQTNDLKRTTDEAALDRIRKRTVAVNDNVPNKEKQARKDRAQQVAALILDARDLSRQASSLKETLLDNGRMRTTLVAGGTETYRLSSHKTWNDKGHNQQNVDKRLRRCFVPDTGFVMVQQDQSRAESNCVAHLAQDEEYIKAHASSVNTHIYVARLIWPNLDWTGDEETDKEYAIKYSIDGQLATRAGSDIYRISKAIQHGSNYGMTYYGVARNAGISIADAGKAQDVYFGRFPRIPKWQEEVRQEVAEDGRLQLPGFYRIFMGPRGSNSTWREALATGPQAIIAWTNHIVFARLYRELDGPDYQVLGHGHDSVLAQVRPGWWAMCSEVVKELSIVTWPIHGREMTIEWEWQTGSNWNEVS